jgi:cobalt-zinc-cadmium efflux system outer membrane protein
MSFLVTTSRLLTLVSVRSVHSVRHFSGGRLLQTPRITYAVGLAFAIAGASCSAQQPVSPTSASQISSLPNALTWRQVQDHFRASNPTLRAGAIGIDESRAEETTAHLRPNPTFYAGLDQATLFHADPFQPLSQAYPNITFNYLHERDHKRELRTDSAKQGTKIAISTQSDLIRTLGYALRSQFVQTLQAKAILELTKENLAFYDHVLSISRDRFKAGDIAQVDLDRLELGRLQYEQDNETADVNVRTAKIQLLQLLNDRTPVDQFDVVGPFEFSDTLRPLEEYHQAAIAGRPDLQAAMQTVEKAKIDHNLAIANGSTDPTFGFDAAHQTNPLNSYLGVSVSVPLRIFDRNQGEKRRTLLDIDLQQQQAEAARAQVFADVDSAYATVDSQLKLLRPYRGKYLEQARNVRETISFSYQHGGASLLDFLQAQSDYRAVQLGYLNMVGAYLTAAAQMNEAVGQDVLQ